MNEEQQQTNNPGGEVQEAPQVEVNAVDVANAVKIIDAAAQRGAFQGNELTTVGSCRDRLESYIAHLRPQTETYAEGTESE